MEVINMGQPQVIDNPLAAGLTEAGRGIAGGIEGAAESNVEAQKFRLDQQNLKNKYQVELARIQHKQDEEDYKHTQSTLERLGIMKDKDPDKYNLLMQSKHGKELIRHVKSVDPDSVNEDAENPADQLIVPGLREQASQKLDEIKLEYANAVKSGKPVPLPLKQAFDAIQIHGQDELSQAIGEAAKNPTSADLDTFRKLVQNQLDMRKEFKAQQAKQQQQQQGGQAGGGQGGQGNPTADALNQQDPLGILNGK